jgi:polysaccharide export outer membrane protein
VRLRRGAASATAPLGEIIANPKLDVPLSPGDTVTLLPRRLAFYAFGAVNHPGIFAYDQPEIMLIQALAETAGLQDERAAPRGVFIYRPGPAEIVYQLDLSQPQGFFLASRFALRPDDVIYVSDAPVADVAKVLQTITGVGSVAAIPRNFGAPY